MNYSLLVEFVRDIERELIDRFGVAATDAASIASYVEASAVQSEARCRKERQLLLDFKEYGSKALAKRFEVTDRTIRSWRSEILRKKVGG